MVEREQFCFETLITVKVLEPITRVWPMTDVASQRQEESGYGEVKGEAGGTEGSAREKLIQCKMKKMKESTVKIPDPPQR